MTGPLNRETPELPRKMKRIGIISDIHGNYHALQAVLERLEDEKLDGIICCGDVVGYGARPNECVDTLRRLEIPTIAGNHDHAALLLTDVTNFNEIAKAAIYWTKKVLREDNISFLQAMNLTIRDTENDALFVHASPRDPGEWNYILSMPDARMNFNYFTERICFLGHTHQPWIIENENGNITCLTTPEIKLREGCRYLVNVGSVGQPRDHNPRSCYVIMDFETQTLKIKRCDYDLQGSQQAIIAAGLPRELAERLAHGM